MATIDQAVIDAVCSMDRNNAYAIIAIVEDEKIKMNGQPIPRNDKESSAVQMDAIRIMCMRQEGAFIIVKQSPSEQPRLVLLASETSKPKTRMLLATSAAMLKERCKAQAGVNFDHESQISHPKELTPKLFEKAKKEDAMTEREKVHEKIAEVQKEEIKEAPQKQQTVMLGMCAMMGAQLKLNDEAVATLKELAEGNISACVIACEPPSLVVKKKLDKAMGAAEIAAAVPADVPSFMFARWPGVDDQLFFIYTVPVAAAPKSKAPYVATKPSLIAQAEERCGVKVTKRVELDDPKQMQERVKQSMEGNDSVANMAVAPDKKITMVKGPRMLLG